MWGALMGNDFELSMMRHIKGKKDHICHLCDGIIPKGKTHMIIVESVDGKHYKLRAHDSCMNLAFTLCDKCHKAEKECRSRCKDCFNERAKVFSEKELAKKFKPLFDALPQMRNIKVTDNLAIAFDYKNGKLLEINMYSFIGDFFSIPRGVDIYRDWYKKKD